MPQLQSTIRWPASDRGRVLVEATDWSMRQSLSALLTDAGYDVASCAGPAGTDQRCPLTSDEGCRTAAGADIVLHTLHPGDPRNREVLLALRRRHPEAAIVVQVPEPAVKRHPEYYEDCVVLHSPVTRETLLDAVERGVRQRRGARRSCSE